MSHFLHDRPIQGDDDNLLWPHGSPFRQEISGISQTMAAALTVPSPSITFAVHGPWGTGKSSAMALIQSEAVKEAGTGADRLLFARYCCPAFEVMHTSGAHDVQKTLGGKMLEALAGGSDERRAGWLLRNLREAHLVAEEQASWGESDKVKLRAVMQEIARRLTPMVDFAGLVEEFLGAGDFGPRALMVFIDDADRCGPDFVWAVLKAIQQWSDVRNLFFVLGMDKGYLRRTILERPGVSGAEDLALEKYVQHAVHVPEVDDEGVALYLDNLGRMYNDDADGLSGLFSVLKDNAKWFRLGLRTSAARLVSPRSIKRCINVLTVPLRRYLGSQPAPKDEAVCIFLKERVLEHSWREFHDLYYKPAWRDRQRSPQGAYYWGFYAVEEACWRFAADRDVGRLKFEMERISQRLAPLPVELPSELAAFLGEPPFFFFRDDPPPPMPISAFLSTLLGKAPPAEGSQPKDLLSGLQMAGFADRARVRPTRVEARLRQLYYDAQAAEMAMDQNEIERVTTVVSEFIRDQRGILDTIPKEASSLLGDIAYTLDSPEFFLASLDFPAEPRVEANNLLRFLLLILRESGGEPHPLAEQLFPRLKELTPHLPDDDAREAVGFIEATLTGGRPAIDPSVIEAVLANPSEQSRFRRVALMVAQAGDCSTLRTLTRTGLSVFPRDVRTLRLLADTLAASGVRSDEEEAIDIYRFLLRQAEETGDTETYDVPPLCHNLATLLFKPGFDYDDEAGKLWHKAYGLNPESTHIRNSYASYLARARKPELAGQVSRGIPFDDKDPVVTIPTEKSLPDFFLPDQLRWWENLWDHVHRDGGGGFEGTTRDGPRHQLGESGTAYPDLPEGPASLGFHGPLSN